MSCHNGEGTADSLESDVEEHIRHVKGDDNFIIVGDWNAKGGCGKEGKVVCEHGLGEKKDWGDGLIKLGTKRYLVLGNTLFKNINKEYTLEGTVRQG